VRFLLIIIAFVFLPLTSVYADIFRILDSEGDALQCRIDLIQQSKQQVLLSYYVVNEDLVGLALFDLLVEASRDRGVKVCLLIDAVRSKISKPVVAYLEENGVQVRVFNPGSIWRPLNYARRLHDKLFLVDETNFIVGGRNIKKEYYALGKGKNFLDRDVLVQSEKAIKKAQFHFFSIWDNRKLSFASPTIKLTDKERIKIKHDFAESRILIQNERGMYLYTGYDWATGQPQTAGPVSFECDRFYKRGKNGKIENSDIKISGSTASLLKLINVAKKSITIENAYVIPTKKWTRALKKALNRGVKIRILTNSMATNDVMMAQAAYLNNRRKLINMGIDIWEYQGPKTLHIKSTVIDDSISIVSSYNLHALSERWSTEVAVWVADTSLAKQHRAIMDRHLSNATHIGPNNVRIENPGHHFGPYPFCLRAQVAITRYTLAWILKLL